MAISLKKKTGTPLIEELYVVHKRQYQIRLKDTQECMSAVSTYEDVVKCGKLLCERYGTAENLRRLLSQCEYPQTPAEHEKIRRDYEQTIALEDDLYKRWYNDVKGNIRIREETNNRPKVGLRKRFKVSAEF